MGLAQSDFRVEAPTPQNFAAPGIQRPGLAPMAVCPGHVVWDMALARANRKNFSTGVRGHLDSPYVKTRFLVPKNSLVIAGRRFSSARPIILASDGSHSAAGGTHEL